MTNAMYGFIIKIKERNRFIVFFFFLVFGFNTSFNLFLVISWWSVHLTSAPEYIVSNQFTNQFLCKKLTAFILESKVRDKRPDDISSKINYHGEFPPALMGYEPRMTELVTCAGQFQIFWSFSLRKTDFNMSPYVFVISLVFSG